MDEQSSNDAGMGTKPIKEHEWLQNLVGEWTVECSMTMPDGSSVTTHGTESVTSLGGLWAHAEGHSIMPDGNPMTSFMALGYDVSFKEYRGCWYATASSHLWRYVGTLSEDGRTMTLNCEGPDMMNDGETANYRDTVTIVDKDHRTLTSRGQDKATGEWFEFMVARYTRA